MCWRHSTLVFSAIFFSKYGNFIGFFSQKDPLQDFAGFAVQFYLSPSGEILPKRKKKNGDMSHIKGCFKTLYYFLHFVWNCVIGCKYVVSLNHLTTLDDYRVILIVILSLGPSLTQKTLIHPKFECRPKRS